MRIKCMECLPVGSSIFLMVMFEGGIMLGMTV